MRNKTPAVCQKHQPGPDLPPSIIWPSLRAVVTIIHPDAAPVEIWTQTIQLAFNGPALNYAGEYLDSRGYFWNASIVFTTNYVAWTAQVFLSGPPPLPVGDSPFETPNLHKNPVDTGLALAKTVLRADDIRWRFTA